MANILTRELLQFIRAQYQLDWHGIHGVGHWARVRARGLALSQETGANPRLVTLFAFLHDCARLDDRRDLGHGERAAALIARLNGRYFHVSPEEEAVLSEAIAGHTVQRWHANPTIATCWDADRLDLIRLGIRPDPARLCTEAGKQWAAALSGSLER